MLMYIHVNVVFELLYKNTAIIELPILSATKYSHYTYSMCHCVYDDGMVVHTTQLIKILILIQYKSVPASI